MSNLVQNPYPILTDANGDPLEDGYVFIGVAGLNPLSNPLQAYWDTALTVPANAIRTKGGYPSNSGTPGRLYTADNYSILVQDKNNVTVYSQLNAIDYVGTLLTTNVSSVDTIADLRNVIPASANTQISVGGSVTVGDGILAPLYYWDPLSSATDNGVSVIQPTLATGNGRWLWISPASRGKNSVVLTNYTGTGVPAIAAGSFCEINGTLHTNLSDVAISGTTSDNTWYDILLTPSGSTFTASFVARSTGVWSDTKQGLYSGDNRVVACAYRVGSTNWINKNILVVVNRTIKISVNIGDWNMDTTQEVQVTHGLSDFTKIRDMQCTIRVDSDAAVQEMFTLPKRGVSDQIDADIYAVRGADLRLWRRTGGTMDSTNLDATSFNRGWIAIQYTV